MKEYPKLIGLCGRQYSGKSLLAKYLVENKGYTRIYIAQSLKELCSELFNLSIEEMDKLKMEQKDYVFGEKEFKIISEKVDIPYDAVVSTFKDINNTITSVRHAYQFIGSELIRKFNPDWHVNTMINKMNPDSKYVVDDVRFPNESSAITKMGGILIYIVRPQLTGVSHHMSEESLDWVNFENLIVNNLYEEHAITQLLEILEEGKNEYASKLLRKHRQTFTTIGRNRRITVDKEECPAHVTIYDCTLGWVTDTYDGVNNPFAIEEIKRLI